VDDQGEDGMIIKAESFETGCDDNDDDNGGIVSFDGKFYYRWC
jgi:hypothetical protein